MLCSQLLNTVGLALDIVGFSILAFLAFPALMRKDFVSETRVRLDGVEVDAFSEFERLNDPVGTEQRRKQRQRRLTCAYILGGVFVVLGFLLQIVAIYVP